MLSYFLPIITIEDLNRLRGSVLGSLYTALKIEYDEECLDLMVPDKDSYFWGDSTKYHHAVTQEVWQEAIIKSGVEETMNRFGYWA